MRNEKKISSLVIILLLIFSVGGCKDGTGLSVIESNLADYQKGVKVDTKQVRLKFSQPLAEAKVTLKQNGKERKETTLELREEEVIVSNLDLVPRAEYELILTATSDTGSSVTNSYQFVAVPALHPQVENKNKTLLQAFYWKMGVYPYLEEYPAEKNLWKLLAERAAKFKELGFTSVWIPPANKADSPRDEGYAVYDLWEIGRAHV